MALCNKLRLPAVFILALTFALGACATPSRYLAATHTAPTATPAANSAEFSYNYPQMFSFARELLTRTEVKKFLKKAFAEELLISDELQKKFGYPEKETDMAESQFVLLLQHNPKLWKFLEQYIKAVPEIKEGNKKQAEVIKEWRAKFLEVIDDKGVLEAFKKYNDPTEPMPLLTPPGETGYKNMRFFVDHAMVKNGQKIAPSNLKQVWLDFINSATKELAINVYDFDLQEVADALIAKAGEGVAIRLGIDAGVIGQRPEVKAIFDQLKKTKGITAKAIDAVGLNHQKLGTKDWSLPQKAGVLFSSGNLTQSCIGPEGDLPQIPAKDRPAFSIPNANHVVTMDSMVLANLVNHELTKTIDLGLRGKEYPLGGSYLVHGPKGNGPHDPYVIVAFSPHGGLGNINNDIIAKTLLSTRGPVRMLQFAFSSQDVENALLERAKLEAKEGHDFDFGSVGDTPFAMRDWSIFLNMSGYELNVEGTHHEYRAMKKSEWADALGAAKFQELKANIRVAPATYGKHQWTGPDGKSYEVTSKVHHKFMRSGDAVIMGTSFNFSENALTNNEQILVVVDREIADASMAMFEGLRADSPRSVEETAVKRNSFKTDDDAGIDELQVKPDSKAKLLESFLVGRSKAGKARAAAETARTCVEDLTAK